MSTHKNAGDERIVTAGDNSAHFGQDDVADENIVSLDPAVIRQGIEFDHEKVLKDARNGIEALARFKDTTKGVIETDEVAEKTSAFVAQLKRSKTALDTARKGEKAPFDQAAKVVDGVFNALIKPLGEAVDYLGRAQTTFLIKKRQEAEAAAQLERKRAQEAADKAEAEAMASGRSEDLEAAAAHAANADKVERQTRATAQEQARTRSDYGTMTNLRRTKNYRTNDFAQVPREYLMVNHDAVRAALKQWKDGEPQPIPGIEFYFDESAVTR